MQENYISISLWTGLHNRYRTLYTPVKIPQLPYKNPFKAYKQRKHQRLYKTPTKYLKHAPTKCLEHSIKSFNHPIKPIEALKKTINIPKKLIKPIKIIRRKQQKPCFKNKTPQNTSQSTELNWRQSTRLGDAIRSSAPVGRGLGALPTEVHERGELSCGKWRELWGKRRAPFGEVAQTDATQRGTRSVNGLRLFGVPGIFDQPFGCGVLQSRRFFFEVFWG